MSTNFEERGKSLPQKKLNSLSTIFY